MRTCVLLTVLLAQTPAKAPAPLVIPLKARDLYVCAEYLSDGAPRDVERSCVDAATVRAWLLQNGRPECGP